MRKLKISRCLKFMYMIIFLRCSRIEGNNRKSRLIEACKFLMFIRQMLIVRYLAIVRMTSSNVYHHNKLQKIQFVSFPPLVTARDIMKNWVSRCEWEIEEKIISLKCRLFYDVWNSLIALFGCFLLPLLI